MTKNIDIRLLCRNTGQINGLSRNPRFIRDEKFDKLKKSIEENPEMLSLRELLVYPVGEQYVVIGGNMRLEACKALGYKTVPCKVLDAATTVEQLQAYTVKDNAGFGEWDWDALANEWTDLPLEDWGVDMPEWEQTDDDDQKEKNVQEDDFDEEKDKVETVCKKGDIWQLGNHRLMCGDSTNPNNFARLMDGNIADIAFTSPPYGVNDGSIRKHQEKGKSDHSVKNFYLEHNDNMGTWPSLVEETWQRMHENSKQQFINIQMLADNKRELLQWAARHADHFVDMLIWNKVNAAPQMNPNVVNNVYENIYVFGEKDATRKLEFGAFRGNQSAIIEVRVGNNEYSDIHKAVFPVALPAAILNINSKAKSVLDCFGGTGTTMIAAEQLGRRCYMMEIDPHYCDVIIARWEKLTGQTAVRLTD